MDNIPSSLIIIAMISVCLYCVHIGSEDGYKKGLEAEAKKEHEETVKRIFDRRRRFDKLHQDALMWQGQEAADKLWEEFKIEVTKEEEEIRIAKVHSAINC